MRRGNVPRHPLLRCVLLMEVGPSELSAELLEQGSSSWLQYLSGMCVAEPPCGSRILASDEETLTNIGDRCLLC